MLDPIPQFIHAESIELPVKALKRIAVVSYPFKMESELHPRGKVYNMVGKRITHVVPCSGYII